MFSLLTKITNTRQRHLTRCDQRLTQRFPIGETQFGRHIINLTSIGTEVRLNSLKFFVQLTANRWLNPSSISYTTLQYNLRGTDRNPPINLLDVGVSKTFQLRGGKNRLKLTLDGFNMTNISTVTSFRTSNISASANATGTPQYLQVSAIVPPRVFRVGASFTF